VHVHVVPIAHEGDSPSGDAGRTELLVPAVSGAGSVLGVGLYREHVVPRLVNLTCGTKEVGRWRAQTRAGLSGRVVEIGFGSGLNLGHDQPDMDVVLAVEPAAVARRMADTPGVTTKSASAP
jgi:hypothetical protein